MMTVVQVVQILVAVVIVSFASLIGIVTLIFRKDILETALIYLVAFATGSLLGAVFFDLFPEVIDIRGEYDLLIPISILVGMLGVYLLEKVVRWHHHHALDHDRFNGSPRSNSKGTIKPYVYNNLIGDGLHNFVDGLALAVAFYTSFELGFIVFLVVLAHEIAQEIGDFSILIKGGLSVRNALMFNFASALTAVLGALIGIFFLSEPQFSHLVDTLTILVLSVTIGIFLYLSLTDLVPELHQEIDAFASIKITIVGMLGVVIIYLVTSLELSL